jgi:AraC family transcriptional regulator
MGRFESRYGWATLALDATHAIYRPACVEHSDRYPSEAVCISIGLPAGAATKAPAVLEDPELAAAARRLSAEMDATDSAATIALEALCAQIAARFGPARLPEPPRARWIRIVRQLIEDCYADPPTLASIAATVQREVSHVASTFRRTYGLSIGEYVRQLRLWHSRTLLEDGGVPLAEVAMSAGFSDQSHFTRAFKRHFRMTPGEYRRRSH